MGNIKYVKSVLNEMRNELLNRNWNKTLEQNPNVSRFLYLDNMTAEIIKSFLDHSYTFFQKDNLYYLEVNMYQINKLITELAH